MPLVFAKAVATTLKNESGVRIAYQQVVKDYADKGQITEKQMGELEELGRQLNEMPLVKVTEDVAKTQITYEETEDKI